jgi:hypothetical protein
MSHLNLAYGFGPVVLFDKTVYGQPLSTNIDLRVEGSWILYHQIEVVLRRH